jgi:cell division protein FtsW
MDAGFSPSFAADFRPARPGCLRTRDESTPGAPDWLLMAAVLGMLGLGLIMVFSASIGAGEALHHDPYYFFKRQMSIAFMGLALMCLIIWLLPRSLIELLQYPALGVCLVLLVLCLVAPAGTPKAKRWLNLYVATLQPMEFTKIALVCYLGYFFSNKQHLVKTFNRGLLPLFIVTGTICVLLLLQPDFGAAVVMCMLLFFMCLAGGARFFYLCITGLLAAAGAWLLTINSGYRLLRLNIFLDPFSYPEKAYQIIQSFLALGSGGISGVGLGLGKAKLLYLPEIHTDFIIAALGEELGLIGISAVFALILLLGWRGLRTAMLQNDLRGRLTAFGLTLVLIIPMLLNLAVVSSSIPAKGVAMPFFSYGGSSLLSSLICAGLLLKYSRYARREKAHVD